MSDSRFKIVFDGALRPGVESTTAKLNLAELFKSDVDAIEKLFTGRPVALKRDLSHSDAETYLTALHNAGWTHASKPNSPWHSAWQKPTRQARQPLTAPPRHLMHHHALPLATTCRSSPL